jgi:hypothetical protein
MMMMMMIVIIMNFKPLLFKTKINILNTYQYIYKDEWTLILAFCLNILINSTLSLITGNVF